MFGFSIRYIQILLLFVYTTLFATKVSQNVTVKRYLKECECEGTRRIAEFESKKIESKKIESNRNFSSSKPTMEVCTTTKTT